jgi:hypothetical protein
MTGFVHRVIHSKLGNANHHLTKYRDDQTIRLCTIPVPIWLKSIVVSIVLAGIGKGLAVFLKHLYAQILVDLDDARLTLGRATGSATSVMTPEEEIIKHVFWPTWLVKRAKNYQKRRAKLKQF